MSASRSSSPLESSASSTSSVESIQGTHHQKKKLANSYNVVLEKELNKKYKIINYLESGAYGHVYLAEDLTVSPLQSNSSVIIKKVVHIFDDVVSAKRLLREIKILRTLSHPNIIGFKELLQPPSKLDNFNDLSLVFEYMDTDLKKLIHTHQTISNKDIQYIMYQLLCGIEYMHSANILHRDLKPENIFINENYELKIGDFGLSRLDSHFMPISQKDNSTSSKPKLIRSMTKHIVTRHYRAPELILLTDDYSKAIDLWSIGCILSELLAMQAQVQTLPKDRKTTLFPGRSCFPLSGEPFSYWDPSDQLNLIFDIIGTPSPEDFESIDNETAHGYIKALSKKKGIDFNSKFPDADPLAIDMLKKLLQFNPKKRGTATQLLQHEYLKNFRQKNPLFKSSSNTQGASLSKWNFENDDSLNLDKIHKLITEEIYIDHPHLRSNSSSSVSSTAFVSGALSSAVQNLGLETQSYSSSSIEKSRAEDSPRSISISISESENEEFNRDEMTKSLLKKSPAKDDSRTTNLTSKAAMYVLKSEEPNTDEMTQKKNRKETCRPM